MARTYSSSVAPAPSARRAAGGGSGAGRGFLIGVLVALASLVLIASVVSIWADELFLNASNWEHTSAKLLDSATFRASAAGYIVDTVDAEVGHLISGQPTGSLPPAARLLTRAGRPAALSQVELALATPPVRALWAAANGHAAAELVAIVNGDRPIGPSTTVSIDLDSVLRGVGTRIGLPRQLTVQLPSGTARLTVLDAQGVHDVRTAGRVTRALARWLIVGVGVLVLLALALSRRRLLRTLAWTGVAAAAAGVGVLIARAVVAAPIADAVTDSASLRRTLTAAIDTCTHSLTTPAIALIAGGLLLSVLAAGAGLVVGRRAAPRLS